jgi:hypothetical protein
MSENVIIVRGIGAPLSTITEIDANECEDLETKGRKFAQYMLNNTARGFNRGFTKEWQEWHAKACKEYRYGDFSYCKNNTLCDCCKFRFECFTQ